MGTFPVLDANGDTVTIGSFWVPGVTKGNFVPQAAYANPGLCMGGLISSVVGDAATAYMLQMLQLSILGLTAGQAVELLVFDAEPTVSTFTDNVAAVLLAADLPKLVYQTSLPAGPEYLGAQLPASFSCNPRRSITTDADGKIWLAFLSGGGITQSGNKAEWRVEVRG